MRGDWRRGPWRHVVRRKSEIRAEIDDEIRFHIEMRIAELERAGLRPSQARAEALRQFGDLDETRTVCTLSDERRESHMQRRRYFDELRQDIVHGLRQLRRHWSLTALAMLTLGIGVGASTAIFSATDHVLLRPLPYGGAERAVTLWETNEQQGRRTLEVSPGNFLEWRKRSRTLAAIGLAEPYSYDLATDGPPEAVPAWRVTPGWFEALGVQPVLGRLFRAEEYEGSEPLAVLISEGLWQRRLGGDPRVAGKTLRLDGRLVTIAGVISASVKYPEAIDIWAPKSFRPDELIDHSSQYMRVVGRLENRVAMSQVQEDFTRIAHELEVEHPTTNRASGINVVPLREQVLGKVRPALLILLGAVGFLLLIACANVASLLLAAGAERGRELSVRAALGAGRNRLLHQLATESLLLALCGGVLGLIIARLGVAALIALSPAELPRVENITIDGRVLAFSLAITLLTALLCGLAPALRFSRPDLVTTLREHGRSVTSGRDRNRLRAALVRTEVAAALVLLIGAGLLGRSFVRLLSNDLGFETKNRVSLQAFLWDLNPKPEQMANKVAEFEAAMRSTPGVSGVGVVSALPFHPHAIDAKTKMLIRGRAVAESEVPSVYTTIATADYFKVLGIRLKRGRLFNELDRIDAPKAVLINETVARRFFAGEDPVGQIITVGAMSKSEPRTIVGVVGDVRPLALDSDARPEVFVPFAQNVNGSLTFVMQTTRPARAMLPLLRERFWSVDSRQSIYWSATVEDLVGATLVERRFNLILLAVFSAIALVLAAVGIYGLISFGTQQRVNEIGVRMALGAERMQIVRMIILQGLRLALPGILLGVAGALLLTRFLRAMLFGVAPTDPLTFLELAALMAVVAAAAAWLPARRAVRGAPIQAIMTQRQG